MRAQEKGTTSGRLRLARTEIVSGTSLAAVQNGLLLIWTFLMFIGARSDLILSLSTWTGYAVFIIDLVALPLAGMGFYHLSQCYTSVGKQARNASILLIGWALPSLGWRRLADILSISGMEKLVRGVNPKLVGEILAQVFGQSYLAFVLSGIILSLAFYSLNGLLGELFEDLGVIETGRRRLYTIFAGLNAASVLTVGVTFLWIELFSAVQMQLLTSAFLLAGISFACLLVGFYPSGQRMTETIALTVICIAGVWVVFGKAGSFDELTAVTLVLAIAVILLLHRNDLGLTRRSLGLLSLLLTLGAIVFESWVGAGTLGNSTGAAWLVLGGLAVKGPILSLVGISAFWSICTAFRGLQCSSGLAASLQSNMALHNRRNDQ